MKVIDDFHHFVSVNAHWFVEKPLPDLIQMGLSESMESEVYKQAQKQASQLAIKGKLYLDWRCVVCIYLALLCLQTTLSENGDINVKLICFTK